jgi:hypothetical protein
MYPSYINVLIKSPALVLLYVALYLRAGAGEICVCVWSRGHGGREYGLERQGGRHARIVAPRVCGRVRQAASKGCLEVGARLQLHLPPDAAPERASGALAAPAGPSR